MLAGSCRSAITMTTLGLHRHGFAIGRAAAALLHLGGRHRALAVLHALGAILHGRLCALRGFASGLIAIAGVGSRRGKKAKRHEENESTNGSDHRRSKIWLCWVHFRTGTILNPFWRRMTP